MTEDRHSSVQPVPERLGTVTARLVVERGLEALDFYRQALAATETGHRFMTPTGKLINAELRIGDSVVMITEDTGATDAPTRAPSAVGGAVTAVMSTYWPDVDQAWQRAITAGAEVINPLANQFYGERAGRLRDPFGHQWMLSQQIEDVPAEEVDRRATDFFRFQD